MNVLELRLRGPTSLLGGDDAPSLFAHADAWEAGLYLWTFLYNHSDRINRVGASGEGIARAHADHLARLLRGEHAFHSVEALEAGRLRTVYRPGDGLETYLEHAGDLLGELARLRVFYAPVPEGEDVAARIAAGIARHIEALGGKAVEWFDRGLAVCAAPAANAQPLTVRFYRPVHMASMPDEIDV